MQASKRSKICFKVLKVATLEKFHLRGSNQDPGDPGVGKVTGEKDVFP